ncbi:unnamed protein product [Polarella glacialis]|uniref:Uncharacterized protein n=1 Tax=Polarella glacialis TaxID=89957 RepID=A0A813E8D5_POLGL|nr:unnamed protein product [Polarella glacialis]CAE8684930.1 unnamed protein product [Polarella glacialis]
MSVKAMSVKAEAGLSLLSAALSSDEHGHEAGDQGPRSGRGFAAWRSEQNNEEDIPAIKAAALTGDGVGRHSSEAHGHKAGVFKDVAYCKDWPVSILALEESVGTRGRRAAKTSQTLNFSKQLDSFQITFTDGVDILHKVTVSEDSGDFQILLKVPDLVKSSTMLSSEHKRLKWYYSGTMYSKIITHLPANCTVAECKFRFEPSTFIHNHGIHITVVGYELLDQTDEFWGPLRQEFQEGRAEALRLLEPGLVEELNASIRARKKQPLAVAITKSGEAIRVTKNTGFTTRYNLALSYSMLK